MPQTITERYDGGFVHPDAISRFSLYQNENQDCLNVYATKDGNIKKRGGVTQHSSDAINSTPVYNLHEYYKPSDGSKYLLFRQTDSSDVKLRYVSSTGSTHSNLHTFAAAPTSLDYAQFNDNIYIAVNAASGNKIKRWDGTTLSDGYTNSFSDISPALYPKYLCVYENRLIGADDDKIFWTAVGGDTSTAGDEIEIDPQSGDKITGMVPLGTGIIVFKENHCYFVSAIGELPYVERIQVPVGCISHETIVETPDGILFMGKDGVWHVDRNLSFRSMSKAVDPILQSMTLAEQRTASAAYWRDMYFLSIKYGSASAHNRVLVLDRNIRTSSKNTDRKEFYHPWWIWGGKGMSAASLCVWKMHDNNMYLGESDSGTYSQGLGAIHYYDEDSNDDGTTNNLNIESSWTSGDYPDKDPSTNKVYSRYRIDKYATVGTLTVTITVDDGDASYTYTTTAPETGSVFDSTTEKFGAAPAGAAYSSATFGGGYVYRQNTPLPVNMTGKYIRRKFYNYDSNASWSVYADGYDWKYDSYLRS